MLASVLAVAGFAGCSDGSPADAQLPAEVVDRGYLTVATWFDREGLMTIADDGSLTGFEADLLNAVGDVLGTEIRLVEQDPSTWVSALDDGSIDLAVAQATVTMDRQERASYVSYLRSGNDIVVQTGNPAGIMGMADLCGQAVAVQSTTSQEALLLEESDLCPAGQPIEIVADDDAMREGSARDAVATGAVVAEVIDSMNAEALVRAHPSGGLLEIVRDPLDAAGYAATPIGMLVAKSNRSLIDAIQSALQTLVDDGTYQELVDKYELGDFAVSAIEVNSATS